MSALATKLSALKAKTADLVVKEVDLPESSADPLKLFESNSAARADSSNEWTLDLFPSQVSVFMYIMTLAASTSALIDHKNHAKSSLATVSLYYMTVYHAFFLINDMYVRPTPSAHARSWKESSWKNEFVNFLLTLPVPESMMIIFSQLYATQSERTANVFVVPSAAGFQHDIFYGRFFPVSFFTNIHDCIATMPGNSSRLAILNDLLPRHLYRLRPTAETGFDAIIADLIGITATGNANQTGHYCSTKLYQMFTSIFNPVLFRDFHRRSSLSTIDLATPTFRTMYPNAYDLMFSATSMNLPELKVVLQSMSSLLNGSIPMKNNLCQVISSASGMNAFAHGYSRFALPTFSSNMNIVPGTDFPELTSLRSEEPFSRAHRISFLQPTAAHPPATTDITDVTLSGNTDTITARYFPFSLLLTQNSATPGPTNANFEIMTEENQADYTYPKVMVLDLTNDKTVSAHLATLAGKIIETYELDGTTIELVNTDKSLGLQNSMFADSALPYKYVIRATKFYPRQVGSLPIPLKRAPAVSTARLPASSLLHDRTQIRLPALNDTIIDAGNPTNFPGMTRIGPYNWLKYAQSFLGFRTVTRQANNAALDNITNTEIGRFYVFSPYSYTPYEDQDNDELVPDMSQSRHYFLTNLRTIFGTDFNFVELKHPFEAMPVM
nr:capsid protein [Sarcosphaera coronaria partitivirus]